MQLPGYAPSGTLYNIIKILNGNYSVLYSNITLPVMETINLNTNDVLIIKAIPAIGANTWTGALSNDWQHPGNWSSNIVPTLSVDVVIPANTNYNPVIYAGTNAFCRNIVVQTGADLQTMVGGNLKVGL